MDRAGAEAALASIYDEGAVAYEQHWAPALHRHARDLLVTLPAPDGAGRVVVDVAVGSGALVPTLREAAGREGLVLALDRSIGMLRRVPGPAPRVQSDAARLPLADACADVVVAAFVLFLLPDASRAVAEAARVLRPGGRLLAATWGSQSGTGADAVIREALDAAGAPAFPDLPRSDHLTDSPAALAALLGEGFTDVVTTARPLDARFDPESALAMRTGCGSLGWRFKRLDRRAQDDLRAELVPRIAALEPESLVDRSEVLLTTARRPG